MRGVDMLNFGRLWIQIVLLLWPFTVFSSEMVHSFKNPTFSGNGWSAQVLTVENEEYTRKQALEQQKQAAAAAALAAAQNTNLQKFLNNLESRIYAQLSLQLSNAMFSGTSTSGSMDFQGSTISWVQDLSTNTIKLTIVDPSGNMTDVSVPMGGFKF
jgi:Type VIII secretion system (T8SS), CsgF protein